MDIKEQTQKLTEKLTDSGKIIQGGWAGFRLAVLPIDASEIQVTEMRKAFFAGAAHLFFSIMSILEAGQEPTEKDLNRMSLIHNELNEFQESLKDEVMGKQN